MRLSSRSRYGTRLMLELAIRYGKGPVSLSYIAKSQDISEKYLTQIVIPLRSAGLVSSNRGAHGGYSLNKPPSQITLREIVEPLEGDLKLVDCVNKPAACKRISICVTREIWGRLEDKIIDTLSSVTLEDLTEMYRDKYETAMYNI